MYFDFFLGVTVLLDWDLCLKLKFLQSNSKNYRGITHGQFFYMENIIGFYAYFINLDSGVCIYIQPPDQYDPRPNSRFNSIAAREMSQVIASDALRRCVRINSFVFDLVLKNFNSNAV